MWPARLRLTLQVVSWSVAFITMVQPGLASAGELAWTQDRISVGMHPKGGEAVVSYEHTTLDPPVPPGALVSRVYASRRYTGGAQVETRLCWRTPTGPCVLFLGPQLNTHQFDGLPAQGPFVLVHRVGLWADAPSPLFVSGTVTVWFASPPIGSGRGPS